MGRRVKSMSLAEATAVRTKRGNRSLRCWKCPKWKNAYCAILGKTMIAAHPCCQYGKVLIRAKKIADKRKADES